MKPRRLKLEDGTWRYIVKATKTTIWSPSGKRRVVWNHEIAGYPTTADGHIPGSVWCGDPYCCDPESNPVTPGNLRAYIEANP